MEILKQLKKIKRQINKEKYYNAIKLINLAKVFEDNIDMCSISANENISEATLR